MKILNIAGARPNFMKIAPLMKEMCKYPEIQPTLVHTGQHYDEKMSKMFFDDLQIPRPDINLEVGSASHSVQTAKTMIAFEQVLLKEQPDLVIVVGDVNSTIGCALPAIKLHIPVAHVEAGLRSFDRNMPEEINRVLTDAISDYLFVTEPSGKKNLLNEGIPEEKIYFVGNVMIDTLLANKAKADLLPGIQNKYLYFFELTSFDVDRILVRFEHGLSIDDIHKETEIDIELIEKVNQYFASSVYTRAAPLIPKF